MAAVDRGMETACVKIRKFTDMIVWRKGHELVLEIYRATKAFPKSELFCLVSQIRRAAISVTSNVAEGFGRRTLADKRHFYVMAAGSLSEIKNQMIIALDLRYLDEKRYNCLADLAEDVHRLLNRLISSLSAPEC